MIPVGNWHGVRHYSKVRGFSLDCFVELVNVSEVDAIKLGLMGKIGYLIEVRKHPTGNINDAGLCEVNETRITINVPEKLANTETYILFGSGSEVEFTHSQLCVTLANELSNVLDYLWSNLMPKEVYLEYLKKTCRFDT